MTLTQIHEGLKNGTITIDKQGHFINPLDETIGWTLERLKETKDDNGKPLDEKGLNYRKVALEIDHENGDMLTFEDSYCFDCDKNLAVILLNETTLTVIGKADYFTLVKKYKNYELKVIPEYLEKCELGDLRAKGMLESEINVPTGELIFKNYFDKKEIYESSNTGRSINAIKGRNALMQYLATKDVGYGQMGNMSVNVYLKEDGTEVIIAGSWYYNEKDEECEVGFEGFEPIGSISLSVWRWMCADRETLKKYDEKIVEQDPTFAEVGYATYDVDYHDIVEVKVQPGKWKIEHYFDFEERTDKIYSKLYLIK